MKRWIRVFMILATLVGTGAGDVLQRGPVHAMTHSPTQLQKRVYLTFDDGPNPIYTPQVLNILRAKHVHATFFVLGSRVAQYPDLVRRTYREGNEIGNHGYYHTFIVHKSKSWVQSDINKTDHLLQTICGEKPKFFRPPGGILSKSDLSLVIGAGHSIAMWTLDTNDWRGIPPDQIYDTVLKYVKPDSIILMHDGLTESYNTAKALPIMIDALRQQGYTFDVLPKQFQGTSMGGTTDSNNYRFKQIR